MQYRPKTWIASLAALFIFAFELGFQPVRIMPSQHEARGFVFSLGKPAAPDEAGLAEKLEEIGTKLEEEGLGPEFVEEMTFVDGAPDTLRVATITVNEEQREEDKQKILGVLREEFPEVTVADAVAETSGEKPAAKLGPIGIFRPVPQVRLGLDLQGGAHVVLQAMPSTEMTFATPEDRPMASPPEEAAAAEPPAEEEAAEEPAEKDEAAAEAPEQANEEATEDTEAAPAEADESSEAAKPAAETDWDPGETYESLHEKLSSYLQSQGMEKIDIDVVAPNRILVDSQATDKAEADRQHTTILRWLEAKYPGVKIDAPEPNSVFVDSETADKAQHIIDMRLYSMSDIKEPLVQKQGSDRIIVELPGVKDPRRVTDILRSTAQLEFRLVPERYEPMDAKSNDYTMWTDKQGTGPVSEQAVLAESEVKFTGRDLKPNAVVQSGQRGDWEVRFELKESRKQAFAEFTRDHVGWIMSIVLDKETKMAPVIRSEIMGAGVISGDMTTEEASDLKLLLNAGALPVPLEIVENRQVSATLGADSIRQSLIAGLAGLAVVMVFMMFYYRLPGLLADIALVLYVLIMLAALSTWSPLQATLTLPGIAGIILSIGMAVDANVIIFERLKEELRTRTTARAAAEAGFSRAWTAILDANVTTLMVAAALYFLGTSAIKSFAVTLFLGVCVSLFTAVTVSRWLVSMVVRSSLGEKRWWFGVGPVATTTRSQAPAGSE